MPNAAIMRHWFTVTNGAAAGVLTILSAALAFNLGSALGIVYYEEQAFALAAGLSLFLVYHRSPAKAGYDNGRSIGRAAVEAVIAWAILLASIAFARRFPNYANAVVSQPPELMVGGALFLLALFEAVRRVAGISLVLVILGIMAYTLFGQHLPAEFAAPPADLKRTLVYLVSDADALLGSPIAVAVVVVVPFLFMGEMLRLSAGSAFFTDLALAAVGRASGGSAKVAVVSSALMGCISGSAVSNVMSSGVITIPLMKSGGFPTERAAAIEAVASTGSQLMPPVMGAAAFLMAEFLQISYGIVVLAAIIPSLLYYGALFLAVHLIARRDGIGGLTDKTAVAAVLKRGWFFLVGLLGLLAMLLSGAWQPESAAFVAAAFFAACGVALGYCGTRMRTIDVLTPIVSAGGISIDIIIISAAAGLVIGLLNLSGLTSSISLFLIELAHHSVALLLIFTALVSIVLGMGMPTTGVYVLLATLMAPALIQLGVLPLAAHFFIFYFGMMSMITPPVAMAAFAAASLAGSRPMMTGLKAMMIGWPAFIVPFLLTQNTALLFQGPLPLILLAATLAAVGVAAVTTAGIGFWQRPLDLVPRLVLAAVGVVVMISFFPGHTFFAIRIVLAVAIVLWMRGLPAVRLSS
jgi:TRAP transporter 4TM/12TM fusion protein